MTEETVNRFGTKYVPHSGLPRGSREQRMAEDEKKALEAKVATGEAAKKKLKAPGAGV